MVLPNLGTFPNAFEDRPRTLGSSSLWLLGTQDPSDLSGQDIEITQIKTPITEMESITAIAVAPAESWYLAAPSRPS